MPFDCITIGNRFVRNKGKWINKNKNDIHSSYITGIGFGKLYKEVLKGYKFKTWSIVLFGVSYDYIHWKLLHHDIFIHSKKKELVFVCGKMVNKLD